MKDVLRYEKCKWNNIQGIPEYFLRNWRYIYLTCFKNLTECNILILMFSRFSVVNDTIKCQIISSQHKSQIGYLYIYTHREFMVTSCNILTSRVRRDEFYLVSWRSLCKGHLQTTFIYFHLVISSYFQTTFSVISIVYGTTLLKFILREKKWFLKGKIVLDPWWL